MSDTEQDCSPKAVLDSISCLLADIDEFVESLESRWRSSVVAKVKDSVDDLLALVDLLCDLEPDSAPPLLSDEADDDLPDPPPLTRQNAGVFDDQ